MIVLLLLWHDVTVKAALKSMGDYRYSEAVTATWQRQAGRTAGMSCLQICIVTPLSKQQLEVCCQCDGEECQQH